MTPKQKTMAWLGGGVALMVVGTAVMFVLAKSCTPTPMPKLVLSKETTFLTGPRLADGGIDWVAALEAEARAAGLKDEENGAPALKEALLGFESATTYACAREPYASQEKSGDAYEVIDAAVAALAEGKLDAPDVAVLLAWLDACAPAMEKAKAAAERPSWFLVMPGRRLQLVTTRDQLRPLDDLMQAFTLRLAARATRGDLEGALADAATACALARRVGSPATMWEQSRAVQREVAVLEQLVRSLRGAPVPIVNRALAIVEGPPAALRGEAALREVLRAERLLATSTLDAARLVDPATLGPKQGALEKALIALPQTDLNPLFRRVQRTFDDFERQLLGSDRPAPTRLAAFVAAMSVQIEACPPMKSLGTRPYDLWLHSNEQLANLFVDLMLGGQMRMMLGCFDEWLDSTARRDALMAELAALAGAPERRDSWLGERLIATKQPDGTIVVSGALIDLAHDHGAKDEE